METQEQIKPIIMNFLSAWASFGVYLFAVRLQENAYFTPNSFEQFFKNIGEPTYLTSGPAVAALGFVLNTIFTFIENESQKIGKQNLEQIYKLVTFAVPFGVILLNLALESMGGLTPPEIGLDTFSGDVISGAVGGAMVLLVNVMARRR